MSNFIENCKQAVFQTLDFPMSMYLSTNLRDKDIDDTYESLNIVWFSKTLKNHKALVMSTHYRFDHVYWEVTFNGETNEYYVDRYIKSANEVVKLEDIADEAM